MLDNIQSKIYKAFLEDDNRNAIFYYCGKDSVIGLQYPDSYIKNSMQHLYARVAFIKFTDSAAYINDNIHVNLIPTSATLDSATYSNIIDYDVHVEAYVENGRVSSSRCTLFSNSTSSNNSVNYFNADITEEPYTDENGDTKYGIGVWVRVENMEYIFIKSSSTLSINILDISEYATNYKLELLTQNTKEYDTNIVNIKDLFNPYIITTGSMIVNDIESGVIALEEAYNNTTKEYNQSVIKYSKNLPSNPTTGLTPITVSSDNGDMVTTNVLNNTVSVSESAYYSFQINTDISVSNYTGDPGTILAYISVNSIILETTKIYIAIDTSTNCTNTSNVFTTYLEPTDTVSVHMDLAGVDVLLSTNNISLKMIKN